MRILTTSLESWPGIAKSELAGGWMRWASFACIWIWSGSMGRLSVESSVAKQLTGIFGISNVVVLFATTTALFVTLLLSGKIKTIIDSKLAMNIAGSALSLGSILVGLSVFMGDTNLVFSIVGIAGLIVGGIALAPLKIAWGEMFSKMNLRRGLLCIGYALTSSMLVMILSAQLPLEICALIAIAVSLGCSRLAFGGASKVGESMLKEKTASGTLRFTLSLLLLPMIVALSYGYVRGFMPLLNPGESSAVASWVLYAELFVGVIILALAYIFKTSVGPAQVYSVAIILVVGGLLLLVSQSVAPWISFVIHDMGFVLFYFFMIVYWGDLSWRTGMPIVRIYTIGYLSFQGFNALGTVLGYITLGERTAAASILVVISIVLVLFVLALLLFSNSQSSLRQWLIADSLNVEQSDDIPQACSMLAAKYSLSPRELEVLSLLARGRNASYVSRTLYVSTDTAKTHIKNIYRKLDVHTQQNLIDMIEQNKGAS